MTADPYTTYRRLREIDPVHFDGRTRMWFLTRHEDCATALRSLKFSATLGQTLRRRRDPLPVSMLSSDPPEHTRLREPARKVFAARAINQHSVRVQELVEQLLARASRTHEFDLLADVAGPLALRVIGEMLSVPTKDMKWFGRRVVEASLNLDPLAGPEQLSRGRAAADALVVKFADLLDREGEHPEFSILPALAEECARAGLSREELLAMLNLIVIGGYEPMLHAVGNGMLALLQQPLELSRLRQDPSLVPDAVEELLRYDSPIPVAARVTRRSVIVGGTRIEAGQPVVVLIGAANRDPAAFQDPERLQVDRRPNPHLSFGVGVHFCLGAGIARLVVRAALGAVLERFPDLELAGPVEWRSSIVPRGLKSLPLRVG